jgi:hypothetical protein
MVQGDEIAHWHMEAQICGGSWRCDGSEMRWLMGMRWLIPIYAHSGRWWLKESGGSWRCNSSLICDGSWG